MKTLLSELRAAVVATLALAAVCCGAYPALVWAIAQAAFPHQANGSLVFDRNGAPRGSDLLGQLFTSAKYFHPRPSAAGHGYDAASSGGSNLGPTSKPLHETLQKRIAAWRAENGVPAADTVPADAVTASASGLDPHISPRNAASQAARIARARHLDLGQVQNLIQKNTEAPDFGVWGEPRVNVLRLNLALDSLR